MLVLLPSAAYAGWELVDRVPGTILDADDEQILFVDSGGTPRIRERATQATTTIPLPPPDEAQYGYLTTHGAIFVANDPNTFEGRLYEWRDGSLIDLGLPNSSSSLVVAGDYAIWSGGSVLFRRDLDAGTTITVSTAAGNIENDVAANGDVVFWSYGSDYEVLRYRAGVTTQLTNDPSRWNTYPLTDGVNVVFRNISPCCATEDGSIGVFTAAGQQIMLDSFRSRWPDPREEYAAAGGWVAYTKAGPGSTLEVWTRSPAGVHRRSSPPGMNAWIAGLNPLGEVILYDRSTTHNHFTRPGGQIVDLGPAGSYGRMVKWRDGRWYELRGAALNELRIATYARPKGATPVRMSLAPAFRQCESPNREHGPPLAFGSCSPPVLESDHLTVGTADSNPNPAGFDGYVRMRTLIGDPATPVDEADVRFDLDVSDVRRADDLADYTGELEARLGLELTDKDNTGAPGSGDATIQGSTPIQVTTATPHGLTTGAQVGIFGARFAQCANGPWLVTVTGPDTFTLDHSIGCGSDPGGLTWREHTEVGPSAATGVSVPISFEVPCEATADASIGARCSASTTADAIAPGMVREGGRAIWRLGAVEVYDGGADGDAETSADNTLFARPGLFVP